MAWSELIFAPSVIYCPHLETLFEMILSESSSNQQSTRWSPHFEDAPTTQGLHLESEAVAGTGLRMIEVIKCTDSNQMTRDDARIRKGSCQLGCAWHCAALHSQEEPIVLMWSPAFKLRLRLCTFRMLTQASACRSFFLGLFHGRTNFRSQTSDSWTDAATVVRAGREESQKMSEEKRCRCGKR